MIPDTRLTPTRREIQVLRLIAYGFSNKEIALRLDIAECTVKNHLLNMFQRLGFCNRVHAVVTALKQGWIALSEIEEVTLGRVVEFSEYLPRKTVESFSKAAVRGIHPGKGQMKTVRGAGKTRPIEVLARSGETA
jgi:DNA-binding CsgD family transcriptional regulator